MRARTSTFFAVLIFLYFGCISNGDDLIKHRVKRKVIFTKNSKLFFRLNLKANVIPGIQIFAVAYAIRLNWNLPESVPRRHFFHKRQVSEYIEQIESRQVVQGYYCTMKYICGTIAKLKSEKDCKLFCGLGNIISDSEDGDASFLKSLFTKCEEYELKCPYELHDMLMYSE